MTQTATHPDRQSVSSPSEPIIELRDVKKVYPNGSAPLWGVNLQVKRGDFLFVTGVSGAGKSTLLKMLYGEERASSGEVLVDRVPVHRLKGAQLAQLRRRIGVVFQDYKLIPRRTVTENVAFVLWAQGYNRQEIDRRLVPTLKMVGLSQKAHCFPDQLSGGEQQRVSLARAIVATPAIILADEPTGNLDPDNSWQVLKILQRLNEFGATVVVTTHDERLVKQAKKPVWQLKEGQLIRE